MVRVVARVHSRMTVSPPVEPPTSSLPRTRTAIIVADLVESVRLMQRNEADVVHRWSRFVAEVRADLLPARGGRFVKSLGDGFLLVTDFVPSAAAIALELHQRIARFNEGRSAESWMQLRIGLSVGGIFEDAIDVYGDAVNLASRLAGMAGPGETMISAQARDTLVPGVDPDAEDLGDCFLKNMTGPVRVFRLGTAASDHPVLDSIEHRRSLELRPAIAVIPFHCTLGSDVDGMLGEAMSDEVIAQLARAPEMHVISGLSTRGVRGRRLPVEEIGSHLGAAYVVSGRYRLANDRIRLHIEITDARSRDVLLVETFESTVQDAFDDDLTLARGIVDCIGRAVLQRELDRATTQPPLALESYTLLFGAIGLMHRLSTADFDHAKRLLDELAYRNARSALPNAWLAKWHVLRVAQGWAEDVERESQQALACARQALGANPQNALALAIEGHVHGYLRGDQGRAGERYADALAASPSEPLAWLWMALWHAYGGEGDAAAMAAEKAMRLSPLDPMRYYFESLAATALLAKEDWVRAEALARRSIRGNRMHASSWRTLAISLVPQGKGDEARQAIQRLAEIAPDYTLRSFRERFPGRNGPMAEPWARALQGAGLRE